MGLESRPRTNGLKFNVSVGGLYLRDKMNPDSIMPVLVAPQQRVSATIGQIMSQYMCIKWVRRKALLSVYNSLIPILMVIFNVKLV